MAIQRDEAPLTFSRGERIGLVAFTLFSGIGINGAFVHGRFFQEGSLRDAMSNPIAAAFIVEALVLVVVFAFLLRRWGAVDSIPAGSSPCPWQAAWRSHCRLHCCGGRNDPVGDLIDNN